MINATNVVSNVLESFPVYAFVRLPDQDLVGKRVYNCQDKFIGNVVGILPGKILVEKSLLGTGLLSQKYVVDRSLITLVGKSMIVLEPSEQEYWQLPANSSFDEEGFQPLG